MSSGINLAVKLGKKPVNQDEACAKRTIYRMIRKATPEDAKEICDIYNFYVLNSAATFEEVPLAYAEMRARISAIMQRFPWLVFESEGRILGYAYSSDWKLRTAYRHTAESTVYVRDGYSGRGIGRALYRQLLDELKDLGFHAILGGISLPNEGSVALHEKLGFVKVGQLREVGWKFGRWVDVGYWEYVCGEKQGE
jgi:phosphinothricin acetyltransferase